MLIVLPSDLQISTSTVVSSSQSNTIVNNFTVHTTNSSITLFAQGPLNILISSLSNPLKYLYDNSWSFIASDLESNPSSSSLSTHNPQYTTTSASITTLFHNKIIETEGIIELTIFPQLQYQLLPTITVSNPNSIISACNNNCTLLSSTAISFLYFSTSMTINISVVNGAHPEGNSISVSFDRDNLTF